MNDSDKGRDRPVAELKGIEVTPEMVDAGVRILADEWGIIGENAAKELCVIVYREMLAVRLRDGCVDQKSQ